MRQSATTSRVLAFDTRDVMALLGIGFAARRFPVLLPHLEPPQVDSQFFRFPAEFGAAHPLDIGQIEKRRWEPVEHRRADVVFHVGPEGIDIDRGHGQPLPRSAAIRIQIRELNQL